MSEWISVDDMLPANEDEDYLLMVKVVAKDLGNSLLYAIGNYDGNKWFNFDPDTNIYTALNLNYYKVTHFMKLPEKP